MRSLRQGLALAWLVALPVFPAAAQQPEEQKYIGSQACQPCHPDLWQPFPRNPHFQSIALGDEPPERTGCEGCHGPGGLHVANAGSTEFITAYPELSAAAVLDNCLTCHIEDFGKQQIRRSAHSTGEISCVSCHQIHGSSEVGPLLANEERETCYGCHLEVRAQFDLPFKHRVNEGAVQCSDCHNPHGAPVATWSRAHAPSMVRQAFGNDIVCTECHTDKRGPFVHEHPPVRVEGCQQCHSPHGSVNPRLLARPAVFTMCLECHNGVMGFGTRVEQRIPNPSPGFHNLADPSFQNCLTCHSRIHGSNADPLFRR